MNISQLRAKLYTLIENIDDKEILNAILTILKSNTKSTIVSEPYIHYGSNEGYGKLKSMSSKARKVDYTKPGKPMSVSELKKQIKEAEARINAGKYITQEELEKEMKKW